MEGWVCLHRKLLESRVFSNESLLKVWVWCLLKANHKKAWVPIRTGRGETEVEVGVGSFIFGRKTAAKELKMKSDSVYSRIQKLKKLGNINIQPNTHYSIITIINWEAYQEKEDDGQQQVQHPNNNHSTTIQQPFNTNNNDNKENKKDIPDSDESGSPEFYMTKKKRRLTGKRLLSFNLFWDAFDFKNGKADAADSWLDIPELTDSLVEIIYAAARVEAKNRINSDKSPKWAQGWLTSRRWEDEDLSVTSKTNTGSDLQEIDDEWMRRNGRVG